MYLLVSSWFVIWLHDLGCVMASRVVDTDEELFWKEVQEAVKHVELNHGLSYTIERGTKSAIIGWFINMNNNVGLEVGFVNVSIYEVEPTQPTLMVP